MNTPTTHNLLDHQCKDYKVMLVDDESINTEVIRIYLEDVGYRHFVITNQPSNAIATLKKERPDILLLALKMSGVTGFDILAAMRADNELMDIPVIILTSSNDSTTKFDALNLGVNDILSKPIDSSELTLRVKNTLLANAYLILTQANNRNVAKPSGTLNDGDNSHSIIPDTLDSAFLAENPRFRTLIERFLLRLDEQLDAMQLAFAKKDFTQLANLAHWLKGTSGSVGFNNFTVPSQHLEQLAKAENEAEVEEALTTLRELAANISFSSKQVDHEQTVQK